MGCCLNCRFLYDKGFQICMVTKRLLMWRWCQYENECPSYQLKIFSTYIAPLVSVVLPKLMKDVKKMLEDMLFER